MSLGSWVTVYSIDITQKARKQLLRLPEQVRLQIEGRIDRLAEWPVADLDIKPLKGRRAGTYRLRAGDYRVILLADDGAKSISIREVGHRESIYG